MTQTVHLPYGTRPYPVMVGDDARVCTLPPAPAAVPIREALERALDEPIDCERLEDIVRPGDRVLLVVSDATRDDPRQAYLEAVLERLPGGCRTQLAIANGTHRPGAVEALGLGRFARDLPVLNHDGRRADALVTVGASSRGTPFRVARAAAEADWIVATGQIKPHYFAGFGAGVKSIFPGLGEEAAIRVNHALKRKPRARAGVVDGNPCREDLEEILDFLPPSFLVNSIHDSQHGCQGAVAGDVRSAFRVGARGCRALYEVACEARATVLVSDELPLTSSLYQASKLAAAGAPWAIENLVIVAECGRGTGPLDVIAGGIFEPGIQPRLREPAPAIWLVSSLPPSAVESTYCRPARSLEDIPGLQLVDALVLPRAGVSIV